tara:strand:- start:47 stop:1096 length:1050 start_codon:yes stop_codon:yes gene_type:complete
MNFSFSKSAITSIFCNTPPNSIDLNLAANNLSIDSKEIEKIIKTTGIDKVKVAGNDQTSLDLCYNAAIKMFENLPDKEINKIDAILFVSQTRDYIIPQSSNILQKKLNLRTDILCQDIPMGCSGYVYGLYQANILIMSGCRNILLLAGDVSSKMISKFDKTVSMVFGDAGSATLISNVQSKSFYNIGNDGYKFNDLIINDGGFRNPISESSRALNYYEDGVRRSNSDLFMDGLGIMNFAIKRVPKSIENVLINSNINKEKINLFFLHQANEFMIKYLAKKIKIDYEKVPFEAQKYGNTGPASIPLAICSFFSRNNLDDKSKIILSGFGVGLSWASALLDLSHLKTFNLN